MMNPHGQQQQPPPPAPRPIPPTAKSAGRLLLILGIVFLFAFLPFIAVLLLVADVPAPITALIGAAQLTGPILLAVGFPLRSRWRALYRTGDVALGHVVDVSAAASMNEHGQMSTSTSHKFVRFTFSAAGVMHKGSFNARNPGPAIGTPLWVIHDRQKPARCIPVVSSD